MTSILIKARNSAAYRSGPGYEKILNLLGPENVPRALWDKDKLPLTFLTMCGRNHLTMLNQCLASVAHAWERLPSLHLVSDGSMTTDALKKALNWWKSDCHVIDPTSVIAFHENKNRDGIIHYAKNHIMGVKLAAQLMYAEMGKTLWCDNDVLWFRDFHAERFMNDETLAMKCSADLTPSYDQDLVMELFPQLLTANFCCAGINYLNGNLLRLCNTESYLEYIKTKFGYFTEQTFIAELARQLSSAPFSMEEIAMVTDDAQTLSPTFRNKRWMARHYVTPVRHLFWRDAFFLRLSR